MGPMTSGPGMTATLLYKQRTISTMSQEEKVWLLQATWLCPWHQPEATRHWRIDSPFHMLDPKQSRVHVPGGSRSAHCCGVSISCQFSDSPDVWAEKEPCQKAFLTASLPPSAPSPGGTFPRPAPEHELHRRLIGDLLGTNKELLITLGVPSVEKVLEQEEGCKYPRGTASEADPHHPICSHSTVTGEQLVLDIWMQSL